MSFGDPQIGLLNAILTIIQDQGVELDYETKSVAAALVASDYWWPEAPTYYQRQVNRSFSQNTDEIFERVGAATYRLQKGFEVPSKADASTGDGWTDQELRHCVHAYLWMMEKSDTEVPYKKSEVNQSLRDGLLAKRSRGSIEQRMMNISSVLAAGGREWLKGYAPKSNVGTDVAARIQVLLDEQSEGVDNDRLPAVELERVQSDHIWRAVQRLREDPGGHGFAPSTTYDVLLGDGNRLPPKAVFGLAATEALEFDVLPKHFSGHEGSVPFRIIRDAGFEVVPKDFAPTAAIAPPAPPEDALWTEGKPRWVRHLKKERAGGLAQAKKAAFRREHGKLYCEKCMMDPVAAFGGEHGTACIEVHHTKPVSQMTEGGSTALGDLQCLCANCHRVEHRLLRQAMEVES